MHRLQGMHGRMCGGAEEPIGHHLPHGLRGGDGDLPERQEAVHTEALLAVRQSALRRRLPEQGRGQGDLEEHQGESAGIVMINYEQCIGCGRCVAACPYKARALDAG
ncbi:MAG: 4Fe-4S binding protein [Comamonadaceae bacterium]|nr:4Fe-4S binding protein [Comamonadaceae bacterium]